MIDVEIKSMETELTGNSEAGRGFQKPEKKLQE